MSHDIISELVGVLTSKCHVTPIHPVGVGRFGPLFVEAAVENWFVVQPFIESFARHTIQLMFRDPHLNVVANDA
jgi:hypothetical protein